MTAGTVHRNTGWRRPHCTPPERSFQRGESRMITSRNHIVWLLGAGVVVACNPDSSATRVTQATAPVQASAVRQRLSHADAQAALASVLAGNERAVVSA